VSATTHAPDEFAASVTGSIHIEADSESAWSGQTVFYNYDHTGDRPTVAELAANIQIAPVDRQTHDGHIPDDRADWHRNTTPKTVWMKAHAYRLARDWRCKQLADWFAENPNDTRRFGFTGGDDGLSRYTANPPSQSRLWEIWHEEFEQVEQKICREIAEELFLTAAENAIPLPQGPFQPEDRDGESERSERRLTEEKMRDVWQEAKPIVMDTFYLDRAENAQIPEGSFWEAQAMTGTRQDKCVEDGVDIFRASTTRPVEQQHTGRTHRHHLQKHSVEDVRSMLRETTKRLVRKARRNGELQGKVWAAIDVTKGNPWQGEINWTDENTPSEDYLLGYKEEEDENADYYFQWATIQVVGLDVPLVLDAFPLTRGTSRAEIVDELLGGALDILPDIEMVMMDRDFDSSGVKNVCDDYGVYYLNPARKHSSEKAMCTRLRRAGKKVRVEKQEQSFTDGPLRKRMYLPARNTEVFEPSGETPDDDDDGDEEPSEEERREEYRQGIVEDFIEIDGVGEDDDHGFGDVIEEVREQEEEEPDRGSDEDADAYALFETNHPALDPDVSQSEEQLLKRVRGFIERYSARWGIENGYKQIKEFRARTRSKQHQYRYFCFAFACVLYNVWRLVDLLVKLAFEDDPDYSPRVSSGVFLELTGQHLGLDPPD